MMDMRQLAKAETGRRGFIAGVAAAAVGAAAGASAGGGDTLAATIERLLMHGRVSGWPGDIPDGRVFGMSRSFSKWHLKVGASEIERRDWKVYSK